MKRFAATQLTKDDALEEDEGSNSDNNSPQQNSAKPVDISQRKILKPKSISSKKMVKAPASFTINSSNSSSTQNKNPFAALMNGDPTKGNLTSSSTAKSIGNTFPTSSSSNLDQSAAASKLQNEKDSDYYRNLKGLNVSFMEKLKKETETDVFLDFSVYFETYKKFRKQIIESYSNASGSRKTPPTSTGEERESKRLATNTVGFGGTPTTASITPISAVVSSPISSGLPFSATPAPTPSSTLLPVAAKAAPSSTSLKTNQAPTNSSTGFSFGSLSEGGASTEKTSFNNGFSFSASTNTSNNAPGFVFGDKPSLFGTANPKDNEAKPASDPVKENGSKSSAFTFGSGTTNDPGKPAFSFGSTASDQTKPAFSFGSVSASGSGSDQSNPAFSFGASGNSSAGFTFGGSGVGAGAGTAAGSGGFSFSLPTTSNNQEKKEACDDDDDDGPVEPVEPRNTELLVRGEGEEDEESIFSERGKLSIVSDDKKVSDLGTHLIKLNHNKTTGKVRLLCRVEASGKVTVNSLLAPVLFQRSPGKRQFSLVIVDANHKVSRYFGYFKTPEIVDTFEQSFTKHQKDQAKK